MVNGTITYYLGKTYQKQFSGGTVTVQKSYLVAGQMIAERTIVGGVDTLKWILTDHLGSTSVTANEYGSFNTELRYTAFGEVRYSSGTTPTEFRYTGQQRQAGVSVI